jgi:hypothetical protein
MKQFMTAIGVTAVLLGAHVAAAPPPTSQSAVLKRQINGCMMRRMGADRNLSYKDAMRTCKELLQPSRESLASNGPGVSGTKPR